MTRPVLFLDVDGVLNRTSTRLTDSGVRGCKLQRPGSFTEIVGVVETDKVRRLLELVEETNAKIVVSSSWRVAFNNAAAFGVATGLLQPLRDAKDIFHKDWRTEQKFSSTRAQEISLWLGEHRKVERYAVLDDHPVFRPDSKHLIHEVNTDSRVGLSDREISRVGALLKGEFS